MRWFVYGQDEAVANWASNHIPHARGFGLYTAIGLADGEELIAAVVYHNYLKDHGNIELSMAASTPRWATPEAIKEFLSYPFRQLRCRRVTTCTPQANKRALRFNYGIGFQKEGVIREGYGKGSNMVICGLLYSEAKKWLK